MIVWRKLASAKWADAWEERLRFLGPERLAFVFLPGRKSVRIEAYGLAKAEAALLVREFGGQTRALRDAEWKPSLRESGPALLIRDRLVVVHDPQDLATAKKRYPRRAVLLIPGGIAFGTGRHATTSSCLRLLADEAKQRAGEPWRFLDLGTGSGILAIAAKMLGACRSCGIDFDMAAVRTARANVLANGGVPARFAGKDILVWAPEPAAYEVVAANLFSEVLIAAAEPIAAAVAPGGNLLLSGILRSQEPRTLAAFRREGVRVERVVRRGKWITASLRRKRA